MLKFSNFVSTITEEKAPPRGILHIDHPRENVFGQVHHDEFGRKQYSHGADVIKNTANVLRGVLNRTIEVQEKGDDAVSFHTTVTPDGKVGVKYKGPGAQYNFSQKDVQRQYAEKPYLAKKLGAVLQHIGKVLPSEPGEYQGGFLSTPEDRKVEGGKIKHTPNAITYGVDANSEEGQKLANSKVSVMLHSMLSRSGTTSPIPRNLQFKSHSDVHMMSPHISPEEQNIPAEHKTKTEKHLNSVDKLLDGYDASHLHGHEETLRRYANRVITDNEAPNTVGYINYLKDHHQKLIDGVKTEKAKKAKAATREAAIAHVANNGKAFERTFAIHNAMHNATNAIAEGLNKSASRGYEHQVGDTPAAPEGFVARDDGGRVYKLVSPQIRNALRARSASFKKPVVQESILGR
jgi:hypothetical protein